MLNNRYRIVTLLGQGGFGAVYRAWDTNLERPLALKENLEGSATAARQFKREAQILFDLSHPNLPKVIDHFTVPGQGQYLVMEYVEGEDLGSLLQKAGAPLPEQQVVAWAGQICDALSTLHAQTPPVIHRDIKPANIRITPQGKAMLVDFGIAKVYEPDLSTTAGARAVTPGYSPQEQYGMGHTDARTDVYALGATLYHLLSGVQPPESIQRNLGVELIPLRQINSFVSAAVEQAVMGALAMLPAQRFQSAQAFKAALLAQPGPLALQTQVVQAGVAPPVAFYTQAAVPGTSSVASPWHAPGATKKAVLLLGIAIAAALVVLGMIGYAISTGGQSQASEIALLSPTDPAAPVSSATQITLLLPTSTWLPTSTIPPTNTARPAAAILPPTATTVPTLDPFAPPAEAQAGENWVRPVDNMTMIYIPAGEFLMGAAEDNPDADADEKPQHAVYLDAFWIDQTEISNALFQIFVDSTGYTPESTGDRYTWLRPQDIINPVSSHPVVEVTWNDALAYCQWAGGRLPSEAEWEKAARGTDGRMYPWGNEYSGNLLNACDVNCPMSWRSEIYDDGWKFLSPPGSFPAGQSPYGVLDMAGNVSEFVADWYSDSYYAISPERNPPGPETGEEHVYRGSAWWMGGKFGPVLITVRNSHDVDGNSSGVGFRCAVSAAQP
jgi:serine/threonine-protein kinase